MQNSPNEPPSFGCFVGDLEITVDEQDLINFFSQVGPVVKAKVIRNHSTQISKKYGFVHFDSEELKEAAIAQLNGLSLKGQVINVRNQHYKETDHCLVKPGTRGKDIYIGNIPTGMSKQELYTEAKSWGLPPIGDVRVFKNASGQFCFVSFEDDSHVHTAMEIFTDTSVKRFLGGRQLLVQSKSGNSSNKTPSNTQMIRSNMHDGGKIQQTVAEMKRLLGGAEGCPLNDRQLSLLEKSQRTLYVRNLSPSTTEAALHERFSRYGALRKVIIVSDKDTKVPMGYGFVEFQESQACSNAALQDDGHLDGQMLTLQVSRPPKEIHAIISSAGLVDENGALLPQFNPHAQPQASSQAYFQCPKTGQLFIGDSQHASHYVAQGYIHVSMQQQQQQQQQTVLHQQKQNNSMHGQSHGQKQVYGQQPRNDQRRNSTRDHNRGGQSWQGGPDRRRHEGSHSQRGPNSRFSPY